MKFTIKTKLIALLFLLVIVTGVLVNRRVEEHSQTVYDALDTVSNITVTGKRNTKEYTEECKNIIYKYDKLFSISKPESDIFKINNSPDKVAVSPETFEIISACREFYDLSGKSFDITGGGLFKIWSDAISLGQYPDETEIEKAMAFCGYDTLSLDENGLLVTKGFANQQINLGAVAKGYIADKIAQYLKCTDASGAMIDLGGNIYAHGTKNNGKLWNVGVADPKNPQDLLLTLSLSNKFVITSGDYQRYFDLGDKRYHHIIDTKTGFPSQSGLRSVTIISDSGFLGDALSTVCFLSGLDKGIEAVKSYGVSAVFVTEGGVVHYSADLDETLTPSASGYTFCAF